MDLMEIYQNFKFLSAKSTQEMTLQEFEEFVNGAQRDSRLNEMRNPFLKEHQVAEMIQNYEPNETNKKISK